MQTLPASVREVKSIIEAVNLKTFERFTYLKGKDNLCKFPFASTLDGFKDLLFTPEGLMFDGADPDVDICLTAPLAVSPGDPLYAGDPTLSFERQARPGEVTDLKLSIWRAHAAAAANPRESHQEEMPLPAPRRDNVIELPSAEKQPDRHDRPPRDVMKYGGKVLYGEDWKSTIYMAYKLSWYGPLNKIPDYAGKSKKVGRYYTWGRAELVKRTGLAATTISRHRQRAVDAGLLIEHRRGYPAIDKKGVRHSKKGYCSIWELPFNLPHVFAWKRNTQKEVRKRH